VRCPAERGRNEKGGGVAGAAPGLCGGARRGGGGWGPRGYAPDAMRFGVVVFPGTWSDCDFHYVISEVLRQPVRYVWHRDRNLDDLDCVILPGGFSYGDYLRAGAVAGRSPVVDVLRDFTPRGGVVLGSCNGFQILCEAGLLPGALMRNQCLQYRCQSVHLTVADADNVFTRGLAR